MIRLLDVNVLLALAWPNNLHHDAAHAWFARRKQEGWATCPITQAGFVRISSQPAVTKSVVAVREAIALLSASTSAGVHEFWPQSSSLLDLSPELLPRIMGPQQVTDAILLDLAIRNGGALATFDRRLENLLPPDSPHHSHIEILPLTAEA
jgi:uncharacterized protein